MCNLLLIRYTIGSHCNGLSNGIDGEKRGALSTTRVKKFCTRWSLDKSFSAREFKRKLQ